MWIRNLFACQSFVYLIELNGKWNLKHKLFCKWVIFGIGFMVNGYQKFDIINSFPRIRRSRTKNNKMLNEGGVRTFNVWCVKLDEDGCWWCWVWLRLSWAVQLLVSWSPSVAQWCPPWTEIRQLRLLLYCDHISTIWDI